MSVHRDWLSVPEDAEKSFHRPCWRSIRRYADRWVGLRKKSSRGIKGQRIAFLGWIAEAIMRMQMDYLMQMTMAKEKRLKSCTGDSLVTKKPSWQELAAKVIMTQLMFQMTWNWPSGSQEKLLRTSIFMRDHANSSSSSSPTLNPREEIHLRYNNQILLHQNK